MVWTVGDFATLFSLMVCAETPECAFDRWRYVRALRVGNVQIGTAHSNKDNSNQFSEFSFASHLMLMHSPVLERLRESNGRLISESKDLGNLPEAQRMQNVGADWGNAREYVPVGSIPDTHSRADSEVSRNQSPESRVGEWRLPKGQETAVKVAGSVAEKLPSSSLLMDRAKPASLAQSITRDPAGQEDWEVVSRHSSWGSVGLGGSLEASKLSLNQGMDNSTNSLVGGRVWEVDGKVVSLEPQQVSIQFQVHYTTSTDVQFIAVTGDHESLGAWNTYIPLHYCKDGLWSHSVFLPADTVVEWKFVLVENKEVTRWEECSNRLLQTGHKDKVVHGWWGIH